MQVFLRTGSGALRNAAASFIFTFATASFLQLNLNPKTRVDDKILLFSCISSRFLAQTLVATR